MSITGSVGTVAARPFISNKPPYVDGSVGTVSARALLVPEKLRDLAGTIGTTALSLFLSPEKLLQLSGVIATATSKQLMTNKPPIIEGSSLSIVTKPALQSIPVPAPPYEAFAPILLLTSDVIQIITALFILRMLIWAIKPPKAPKYALVHMGNCDFKIVDYETAKAEKLKIIATGYKYERLEKIMERKVRECLKKMKKST